MAGTIQSRQDAVDYMTWTYFFRRLVQNPTYYGLEGVEQADVNGYLTGLVGKALGELEQSYCLERAEDGRGVYATVLGRIASYYYLAHQTVHHFRESLQPDMTSAQVLQVGRCKRVPTRFISLLILMLLYGTVLVCNIGNFANK